MRGGRVVIVWSGVGPDELRRGPLESLLCDQRHIVFPVDVKISKVMRVDGIRSQVPNAAQRYQLARGGRDRSTDDRMLGSYLLAHVRRERCNHRYRITTI